MDIDLYTVRLADLNFESDFALDFKLNSECSALVVYFDVEFSKSASGHQFSTGPNAPYTHWKQTIFHLDRDLDARKDDTLTGQWDGLEHLQYCTRKNKTAVPFSSCLFLVAGDSQHKRSNTHAGFWNSCSSRLRVSCVQSHRE